MGCRSQAALRYQDQEHAVVDGQLLRNGTKYEDVAGRL